MRAASAGTGLVGGRPRTAAGGRLGVTKGRRRGGDRVARLGAAMDDIETQVDGPGGKGDKRAEARTREKVWAVKFVRPVKQIGNCFRNKWHAPCLLLSVMASSRRNFQI